MEKESLNDLHFNLGMSIRYDFHLWGANYLKLFWLFWIPIDVMNPFQHNWPLMLSCCNRSKLREKILVPDDASSVIIDALWETLRHKTSKGETEPTPKRRLLTVMAEAVYGTTSNNGVREKAAELLGRSGTSGALNCLVEAVSDDRPEVIITAIQSLGLYGDHRFTDIILDRLVDPDEDVSSAAAEALGFLNDPVAIDSLIDMLNSETESILVSTVHALGCLPDIRALESLVSLFRKEGWYDSDKASLVSHTLSKIAKQDEGAVEKLLGFLDDENPWFLAELVDTFEKIGEKRIADPLFALYEKESERIYKEEKREKGRLWLLQKIIGCLRWLEDPRALNMEDCDPPWPEEEDIDLMNLY